MNANVFKKHKYAIIAATITYLVSLLVCVSIFLPINVGGYYKTVGDPIITLGIDEIKSQNNCSVKSTGEYVITGDDPQLIFSAEGQNVECLKFNVALPVDEVLNFEVYTAFADGFFSGERCYRSHIMTGEASAIVDIPQGEYYSLRIDINNENFAFKSIEVYQEQPDIVPYNVPRTFLDYLAVIIIPVVSAVGMWFLNKRFQTLQKICCWFKKNKIKALEAVVFTAVALLCSVLVELVIGLISQTGDFNVYRWIFIAGIVELVVVFVIGYKCLKDKPENIFLPVVLILGAVMLFGSPIKHICWDLDSHYPWALGMSYADEVYITAADQQADVNGSLIALTNDFEGYKDEIEQLNELDKLIVSQKETSFSLAHLPAGIFIAVARFFGASFAFKYNFGRLAYLLVYSFACYFAIKKIKSGKMILATICLFPTNLFLATNYAYDWCVTSFTILGTAYFVSELQQPDKPITIKDTLIMGLAFVIGALPKLVYIVLMGMTLFMRKNWQTKKEKRNYYIAIISIFVALFTYFMVTTLIKVGGPGDSRGGDVNPSAQLLGIISSPLDYAKLLFKFLSQYLSFGSMGGYISFFAYLGFGKLWVIMAWLLLFVSLTDANNRISFKIPLYMKALSILLFVGMAALIATALYINYTPLNAATVSGCQPRYIVPLLAPLLLLVTGRRFNIIKNKSIYNGTVLAVLSAVVMFETYTVIITRMI